MAKKNQLTTSDHLPYEEFTRLLDCLHNDGEYRWEMFARLSFCTACRASDTLRFRWKDVLGVSSVTVVELKTKYRLKIENFSTHTFRKTFGRYVYDTNNHSAESLILLNKILNHHSIQVTKTYIGITQEEIAGVYASISL